jgi:hypothetical protein
MCLIWILFSCIKYTEHVIGSYTVWISTRMPTSGTDDLYGRPHPPQVISQSRRCSVQSTCSLIKETTVFKGIMKFVSDTIYCQFCSQTYGNWDRIPVGARFSAPVQTGPGSYPTSYVMGTGSSPELNRPLCGVDHPPPSSADVKERVWPCLYSPSGPSWLFLG